MIGTFFLLGCLLGVEGAKRTWDPVFTYHYTVKIGGAVAGTMRIRHSVDKEDSDVFRTVESMNATVDRGSDVVKMSFISETIERSDGTVLQSGYNQKMAQTRVKVMYVYPDDHLASDATISVTSTQNGQVTKSSVPLNEPAKGKIHMLRALRAGYQNSNTPGDTLRYHLVKPEAGPLNAAVTATLQSVETESVLGLDTAEVELSKWECLVENVDLTSREWYSMGADRQGIAGVAMVYYEVDSAMGKLVAELDTEGGADEKFKTEENRPELVHSAYVPLDRPYSEMWKAEGRISYRVTTKKGTSAPNIPSAGYQRVIDDGLAKIVVVDMGRPTEKLGDEEVAHFLQNSAMVDGSDEVIREIAGRAKQAAIAKGADPMDVYKLAEAAWMAAKQTVSNSNLATGFATASETARTRTGDCSEYAVLLAALLRALGIPSRTASGLVYLHTENGGNFGWHMWSQALLPKGDGSEDLVWRDMDATLFAPFTYVSFLVIFFFDFFF